MATGQPFPRAADIQPGRKSRCTQRRTLTAGTGSVEVTISEPMRHVCEPLITFGRHYYCTDYLGVYEKYKLVGERFSGGIVQSLFLFCSYMIPVISGTFALGVGEDDSMGVVTRLSGGSFATMPAGSSDVRRWPVGVTGTSRVCTCAGTDASHVAGPTDSTTTSAPHPPHVIVITSSSSVIAARSPSPT